MSQFLVMSVEYGYRGQLPTGVWANVSIHGQAALAPYEPYSAQLSDMMSELKGILRDYLVQDLSVDPEVVKYLGVISHAICVVPLQL